MKPVLLVKASIPTGRGGIVSGDGDEGRIYEKTTKSQLRYLCLCVCVCVCVCVGGGGESGRCWMLEVMVSRRVERLLV